VDPRASDALPPAVARPLRWGLGDFVWIYLLGLVISQVAAGIAFGLEGAPATAGALTVAAAALGLYGGWGGGLVWISRHKGQNSLERDFGLRVRAGRLWALFAGVALQLLLGGMVLPLVHLVNDEKQSVVDDLKNASGAKLVVLLVVAGFLAPIFEELMFRGLLLRALRRKYSPAVAIGVSALVFALGHLVSPTLGTVAVLPALFALGVISGIAATWAGDLSISIPLHMGFNLITLAAYAVMHR
jgi:membrane protease YdiL (CAAX protease family)